MTSLLQNLSACKIFGAKKKDSRSICRAHVEHQGVSFVQVVYCITVLRNSIFTFKTLELKLNRSMIEFAIMIPWYLEKCISVKMSDGTCDDECNTLACNWDGDDCDDISPSQGDTDKRSSFYQSIDFVDVLFSRNIGNG